MPVSIKKSFACSAAAAAMLGSAAISTPALAQEPFLGEIRLVGFNFCPRGWTNADGQILPINSNQALFSLYGTMYGGDGRTSFALPDLRGRTAIHTGQGPGLSNRIQGSRSGSETNTMTTNQMPSHNHVATLRGTTANGTTSLPTGGALSDDGNDRIYSPNTPNTDLIAGSVTTANTGGNQSQNNMQPFLTLRYCVATVGIFPSRN